MTMTMKAKSPLDILAFAPVAIGFTPIESVVMLTFGGTSFHARVDLPTTDEDRNGVTAALVAPAVKHGIERVIFIVYTEGSTATADDAWLNLRFSFLEAGIEIIDALLVKGGRYVSLFNAGINGDADVSTHPFAVQARVEDGRVIESNREAVRDQIAMHDTLGNEWLPEPLPAGASADDLLDEQTMLEDIIALHLPERRFPSASLGTVLVSLANGELRDVALRMIAQREHGAEHMDLWANACARAPQQYRAHAASMFAFAAFMNGHGAAAWMGVEETQAADPNNTLAELLAIALQGAVPPATIAATLLDD